MANNMFIDNTPKIPIAISSLIHGWWEFTPQPDITPYELARCVRVILLNTHNSEIAYQEMINDGLSRHFTSDNDKQVGNIKEAAKRKKREVLPGERDKEGYFKQVDEWEKTEIEKLTKKKQQARGNE